jgi:hypothetical protein
MKKNHKRHAIESFGWQIPDTSVWSAKVVVSWSEGGTEKTNKFDGEVANFRSKAEAETYGIEFAKKWIDDGKPSLADYPGDK